MTNKAIIQRLTMHLTGCILLLVCLFCSSAKAQTRFDYFYLEAEKMRMSEEFSAATALYDHCYRINPEAPEVLYNLGVMHRALGHDSIGTQFLRKACEKDSCNLWYLGALAAYYIDERNTQEVVPVLERMARLDPKRNDVHSQLATIYRTTDQPLKAIDALNRIERNLGITVPLTTEKVTIYCEMGDTAKAYEELDALRAENKHDMVTLVSIGKIYEQMDLLDKAEAMYAEVQRRDPKNEALQFALLEYYQKCNQTERYTAMRDSILFAPGTSVKVRNTMMSEFMYSVKRDTLPDQLVWDALDSLLQRPQADASLYIIKGFYLASSDSVDVEALAETMRDALKVEPNNQLALEHMLQHYGSRNDYANLEEICRRGINYYPEKLEYHYYLSIALIQQQKNADAIDILAQGLRLKPEDANPSLVSDMFALMGDTHYQLGHQKEAFAAYDSAMVYNPENVGCLNNYAYYLSLRNERLDEAEEMSYRTVRIEPKNKTYLDTYAWILFMKEDYTGARRYMERVVDPEAPEDSLLADDEISSVLLEHAGDIYAKCEMMDQALYYWQLAQRIQTAPSAVLRKKIKKKKYIKP